MKLFNLKNPIYWEDELCTWWIVYKDNPTLHTINREAWYKKNEVIQGEERKGHSWSAPSKAICP